MSTDLDDILQSLEKQVNDFTLDIHHGGSTQPNTSAGNTFVKSTTDTPPASSRTMISSSTSHTDLTRRVTKTRKIQLDSDDDDDDAVIGNLLPNSPKSIGLARSLSSGGKKFPKALLPEEPVPSLPTNVPPPPPTTIATNNTTTITQNNTVKHDEDNNEEDLRQAMQLAWAVLDSEPVNSNPVEPSPSLLKQESVDNTATTSATALKHSPSLHNNMQHHRSATNAVTVTMTTRIFIEDAKTYKTVQLTNLLTAAMVIQYLKRKELLDNNDDWTIFEIANSHGIERPLRLWEIVTDITSCWEQHTKNALLVKRYGFYETLTADSLRDRALPVHGWLNIEYKKGKWQKRYCFIKDNAIHQAKDNKCAGATVLCYLNSFDVYTTLQPHTASPTPFVFTLRAQDRAAIFEKEEDYIRYFSAENQSAMEDWVIGIRHAKSMYQYQQYPKRVLNPLAAVSSQGSSQEGVRRHKSLKRDEESNTGDSASNGRSRGMSQGETVKRKASTRGLSRSGTLRHRDDQQQHESNDGSAHLEDNNNNTLIQIDPKVQFSKGSLLDKAESIPLSTPSSSINNNNNNVNNTPAHHNHTNGGGLTRSKSTRDYSSSGNYHRSKGDDTVLSHHTSIRRKDRSGGGRQRDHHDVPLPNTSSIMTSSASSSNPLSPSSKHHNSNSSNNNTLLQLDNTPERFHTQSLLQRQMKPLINFNEKKS
ncbi:hypothetical protein BJ944DRAFT_4711 [Cunninghamella echinulata]|nr:hypothetical protein BJ944DRAFT_4711 [Cunninghamella echinulata]